MKNLIFAFIMVLLTALIVEAHGIQFGIKTGFNGSNQVYQSNGPDITPVSRVVPRWTVRDRDVSGGLGIQSELLYNQGVVIGSLVMRKGQCTCATYL